MAVIIKLRNFQSVDATVEPTGDKLYEKIMMFKGTSPTNHFVHRYREATECLTSLILTVFA